MELAALEGEEGAQNHFQQPERPQTRLQEVCYSICYTAKRLLLLIVIRQHLYIY